MIRLGSTLSALCGGSFVIILLNGIRVLQCIHSAVWRLGFKRGRKFFVPSRWPFALLCFSSFLSPVVYSALWLFSFHFFRSRHTSTAQGVWIFSLNVIKTNFRGYLNESHSRHVVKTFTSWLPWLWKVVEAANFGRTIKCWIIVIVYTKSITLMHSKNSLSGIWMKFYRRYFKVSVPSIDPWIFQQARRIFGRSLCSC